MKDVEKGSSLQTPKGITRNVKTPIPTNSLNFVSKIKLILVFKISIISTSFYVSYNQFEMLFLSPSLDFIHP